MNYYIQGDAANADKIRAAFEKLGYDTSRHLFITKSVLYFTLDGEIRATTCKCTPAIIKTHPDYKELELPVEPKFNVGDWIANDYCAGKVMALTDDAYLLDSGQGIPFSCEHNAHLWTIADAKDGDVLMTANIRSCPFIYRKTDYNNNLAYYYAGIDGNGNFCEGCLKRTLYHFGSVENVVPATKEQRDLLFAKMKDAGYEWDAGKKELRKIKPHYDIDNFKPKQWGLVRDDDEWEWALTRFSHLSNGSVSLFVCINGASFQQCIPFEGNEHLLGTTNMCDEQYINW